MMKHLIILPDGTELFSGPETVNAIQRVTLTQQVNTGTELTMGAVCAAKYLLYNDPFRGFLDSTIPEGCDEYYKNTAETLRKNKLNSKFSNTFETLIRLCDVLELKGTLGIKIRNAYEKKDNKALKN